jgi:inner membrane transporter RhtA
MLRSILLLLVAMLSIQFAASQAKQLFPVVGTAGTSALRLLFASTLMALWFRPWRARFTKNVWLYGGALGLMNFSFYYALQRIPLGIGVALEFVGPLAVAIFTSRKKLDYLWAVLAGLGILLLLPEDTPATALDPIGISLALLAGGFWALYIIFGKRAGTEHAGGVAASMGMLVAAVIVLPAGILIDGPRLLTADALPAVLLVAVLGSALPYSLEMIALRKLPSRTFGILMSLEPALAALMGFLFLTEHLTVLQSAAILCVVISSFGSAVTNRA